MRSTPAHFRRPNDHYDRNWLDKQRPTRANQQRQSHRSLSLPPHSFAAPRSLTPRVPPADQSARPLPGALDTALVQPVCSSPQRSPPSTHRTSFPTCPTHSAWSPWTQRSCSASPRGRAHGMVGRRVLSARAGLGAQLFGLELEECGTARVASIAPNLFPRRSRVLLTDCSVCPGWPFDARRLLAARTFTSPRARPLCGTRSSPTRRLPRLRPPPQSRRRRAASPRTARSCSRAPRRRRPARSAAATRCTTRSGGPRTSSRATSAVVQDTRRVWIGPTRA